ncbi:hypothetical protein ONS95_002103 [Cadophora gregata]|uniref:uncharacterized protein n=1 Tax=Cadophora gregata TaxID=51156 RepID=UPI0026DB59C7|nr:uncharacterized protein ONS95_002103 [Cadophora gregata]KAK0109405.1 hypothetical protein ONS95_002103 [Cadophora gregata]
MGRQEYLTAMALGRGHYEDEIIETAVEGSTSTQQYNDRGHPRNPETKRREREHVRAANEVMQVTGVVEDSLAARQKIMQLMNDKNQETFTGLRFMEIGRGVLVGGVWGVMGLRRRVLLYKPYAETRFLDILRQERSFYGIPHMFLSGVPTVIAYHISDWVAFFVETLIDQYYDGDENPPTERQDFVRNILHNFRDATFCYLTLHFRLFAILQQLNLLPAWPWFPSLKSFIPFSSSSPLTMPPLPSLTTPSILSWGRALATTLAPMLVILLHGKIKYAASSIIYRPIYKALPRPIGDSMFAGLNMSAPTMEYDTPDRPDERQGNRSDEPTLRALEGMPAMTSVHGDDSDDEEEPAHATLISFDVEATEPVENATGTWSAELRSANEPKPTEEVKYRVTGLTMLPPIMATEGLREIVAGIIVMPLEAVMVRIIGRAYRASAGLPMVDLYPVGFTVRGFQNILSALTIQLVVTGIAWAGFTIGTQWWGGRKRAMMAEKAAAESAETAAVD